MLHAKYTENSGYSMRFFRKIGKFVIIGIKLSIKPNKLGRKLRKIGFFAKTGNTSKSLSLQLVAQVSIVENTENSHNTRLYTIQQIGEKFSPIITKSGISSSATTIAFQKRKLLTHKNLKGAINRHSPIVKRITASVTNTHLSSSNAQITKTTKTSVYYKLQHKRILWLVLLVLKAASPLICSTYHRCQTRRNIQL